MKRRRGESDEKSTQQKQCPVVSEAAYNNRRVSQTPPRHSPPARSLSPFNFSFFFCFLLSSPVGVPPATGDATPPSPPPSCCCRFRFALPVCGVEAADAGAGEAMAVVEEGVLRDFLLPAAAEGVEGFGWS